MENKVDEIFVQKKSKFATKISKKLLFKVFKNLGKKLRVNKTGTFNVHEECKNKLNAAVELKSCRQLLKYYDDVGVESDCKSRSGGNEVSKCPSDCQHRHKEYLGDTISNIAASNLKFKDKYSVTGGRKQPANSDHVELTCCRRLICEFSYLDEMRSPKITPSMNDIYSPRHPLSTTPRKTNDDVHDGFRRSVKTPWNDSGYILEQLSPGLLSNCSLDSAVDLAHPFVKAYKV